MAKKDYTNWDINELIKEIDQLRKRKKYGLVWEEKTENVVEQCKKELPVLVEVKNKEIITDPDKPVNLLIEGDNYHALSVLSYTHKGKVDVIYIDPPYNTGENDFKYNDKYVDKEDSFRHSKWLSFMYKRLKLAKQLLKETGVIIIHIDENEFDSLNVLLESEIFLEKNNLGTIVWNKKNPKGDAKGVSTMHEYVLCYAKNKEKFMQLKNTVMRKKPNAIEILKKAKSLYSKIGKTLIPEEITQVIKPFNYPKNILKDFEVKYDLELANKEFQSWISRQDFSGGEKAYKFINTNGRVYQSVSMAWPNKEKAPDDYYIPLIHPFTKKNCPIPERGWRNPPDTMKDLLKKDLIIFGKNESTQPRRKYYLEENMFENTPSIYNYGSSDDDFFKEAGINFPYAKPVEVAKYLISSIHPNPKVVLDFFAGSGTAFHAILDSQETDKQCILVTNDEEKICTEVCYPRIKKVIEGYTGVFDKKKYKGLNGNLKYFKTAFVLADPTDKNKTALTKKATEMLCIKEDTFEKIKSNDQYKIFRNKNRYTGIIFDHRVINDFKKEISKINGKFSIYIFSLGDDAFEEEFEDMGKKVKLSPIPEVILRVYRKIFK